MYFRRAAKCSFHFVRSILTTTRTVAIAFFLLDVVSAVVVVVVVVVVLVQLDRFLFHSFVQNLLIVKY